MFIFVVHTLTRLFPVRSPAPGRVVVDVEEIPAAATEDQIGSSQSDSDDCIVHGQTAGRKVSGCVVNMEEFCF